MTTSRFLFRLVERAGGAEVAHGGFVTSESAWREGDEFVDGRARCFRVVAVEPAPAHRRQRWDGTLVVEQSP